MRREMVQMWKKALQVLGDVYKRQHYNRPPAFVKTGNADAFHTAGQALREEPLSQLTLTAV